MRSIKLAVILLLAMPFSAPAQTSVLFKGVRVFDGEQVITQSDVLVERGVISRIGSSLTAPGAQIVDGTGKTLMPGLIDTHTHTFGDALKDAIIFGVTTSLDMFTDPTFAKAMRAEQRAGRANDRTDLFSAGVLVTTPGGHGTEYGMPIPTITHPDSAQSFVDARIAEGSDYIKLVYDDGALFQIKWTTLSEQTMRAVIAAAHQRGKLAVVHVSTRTAAQRALDAGADGLVHLFVDTVADARLIATAKAKRAFVIPTLVVLKSITGVGGGAPLVNDKELAPFLNTAARAALAQGFPNRPGSPHKDFEYARASVRALHHAGVAILAGTDAPNPGTAHGAALHRELELLVESGLTAVQALEAATSAPARSFGLNDRGRIAPGLRADLVLVNGDPATDIRATRAIAGIWKGGHPIDRAVVARAVAGERARAQAAPQALAAGIISDFEENTLAPRFGTALMGSTDRMAGGTSTGAIAVVDDGANGSKKSLKISGTIAGGFAYPWSGAMWSPGAQPMQPVDLSSKQTITFWSRGDGGTYRVMVFAQAKGMTPVQQEFVAGAEWRQHVVPWSALGLDGKGVMAIIFTGGPKQGDFQFQVDDVVLK